MKICALIPSYNEEATIRNVISPLRNQNMAVYVIDDGSTDKTSDVAASLGAIVVRHNGNKGKGASLIEGFKHILKKDFDAVLIMDGDGQHLAEDIGGFIKKMNESGADIVIGNRMRDTSLMPLVRLKTNLFMSALISKIAGTHIPDSQCGFRLIKTAVLRSLELESSRFDIESEIIIKAARNNFKIESVPIKTVYGNERSKINPIVDTVRFIGFLIKIGCKKT